ncbi:MAG: tRNA dihydrouridine synthase DusB [Victivallaceae bacterium]
MNNLKIRNLSLKSKIVYAPLAGFSDFPFRRMSVSGNPALMFCEMVKVEALVRRIPKTLRILDYSENMRPIGGQICGSIPETVREAGKIIEDMGFDVLDLNCGCPTDRITKDGSGSGLLKTPLVLGKIVKVLVEAVRIPVTVKIRVGWDSSSVNVREVVRILVDSGASGIFVHGRTRAQGYTGPAVRQYIAEAKKEAGPVPIFGNGDIFKPEDVKSMLQETSVDGVLIARGTIGQPWIAEDADKYLKGDPMVVKDFFDRKKMFLRHLEYVWDYYQDEYQVLTAAKKLSGYYLMAHSGVKTLRTSLSKIQTVKDLFDTLSCFDLKEPIAC